MLHPRTGNVITTGTKVDTTPAIPRVLDLSLDAVGNVEQGDGIALAGLCTVFTKASIAASLPDGPRLENLAWRLWGRAHVSALAPGLMVKQLSPVHPPAHPIPAISPHSPSLHPHAADSEYPPPNPHSATSSPNLDSLASPALVPFISASTFTFATGKGAPAVPGGMTSESACGSESASTLVNIDTSSGLISKSGFTSAFASVSDATVPSSVVARGARATDSLVHNGIRHRQALACPSCPRGHNQSATTPHLHSNSDHWQPVGPHHCAEDHRRQHNEQEDRILPAIVPVALPMNTWNTNTMNMDTAEFDSEPVPLQSSPHHLIAVQPCDSESRHFGSHPLTVKHLPLVGRTNPVVDGDVERVTIKDNEGVVHTYHPQGARQDEDLHQEQDERRHDILRASRMHIALPVTRSTPETWPDLGRGAKTQARDQEGRAEAVGVALRHHESHEGVAEGGVMHVVPPGPDHQEAVAVGGCLTPGLTPFERDACVPGPASESELSQALEPGNGFGSFSTGVVQQDQIPAYNIATGMTTQVLASTMGVRITPTSQRVSAPLPLKQGAPTLARLMRRLFRDVDSRVPLKVAEPGNVARVDSTSPLSPSTAISLSLSTSTPTSTPSTSATTTSLSSTIPSIAGDAPAPASASTRASPTIRPAALPLPFPTVIVVNPTPHPTPPATPSPPTDSNSYFRYDTGITNTSGAVNETNTIPSYNIYSTSTLVSPDGPLSVSSNLGNGQLATPTSVHNDTRESEFFPDVCNINVSQSLGEAVPVTHVGINSDTGSTGPGDPPSIASGSISPPRLTSTSMPHVHLSLPAILTTQMDATSSGAVPLDITLSIPTPASTSALIATPETIPLASLPAAQTTKFTSAHGPATSSLHVSVTPATTSATAPPSAPASTNSIAPTSSATSTTVSSSALPSTAFIPASSLLEDKKFFLAAPHSIGSGGSEHSSESPDSVGDRFGKTELSGREVLLGEGAEVVNTREDVFHMTAAGRKANHRDSEVIVENISMVGREKIDRDEEACGSLSTSGSPGVRSGLGRGVSSPVMGRVKGRVVGAGRRKGMKRIVVLKDERGVTQRQVGAEVGKVEMQKPLEQESQREDMAAKSKGKERSMMGDAREGSRSSGALTEVGIPVPTRPHLKSMQQLPLNRLHGPPHPPAHPHTQHTNVHGQGHPYQAQNLRQLPTNPPRRRQSPAHRSASAAPSHAESGQGQGHVQGNDKGLMKSPTSNTDSSYSRTSASHSLRSRANAAGSSHARKHVQDPAPPPPATNTRHLPFHPQLSHLGLGHLPTVPPKQRRPIEITETSSEYETTDTEGDDSSWESDSIDKGKVGAVTRTGGGELCADPSTRGRNAEEDSAKNGPTNSNGSGATVAGAAKNGTTNRTRDAGEFARDAALEAQKQRDLFQKLPERSYSNLAQLPRVKSGISRLFNPDPELFPPGHPYRTTRSSRDLLARNWSAPGPPLAMTAMNRAAAAAPMQAAVNAESVISSVNSTTVAGRSQDGYSAMQRGGYRPRLKPADQEEETDSGEEDPEDTIQVSSSVAHRRLAAIMGSRGTQSQQQLRLPQTTSNPALTSTSQVPLPHSAQPLTRIPTEPILMMHPYLPDPAPLQTPHTVRRNIIAQELDETLRRNLLWERSQNQIQGRPPRAPGSILQGPWRRLTPLKQGQSGEPESQTDASDKAPGMRPFGTQRTKSWAGDFHASGW